MRWFGKRGGRARQFDTGDAGGVYNAAEGEAPAQRSDMATGQFYAYTLITGGNWATGLHAFSTVDRQRAMSFPTVYRAVTLLADLVAQVATSSAHVCDETGAVVESPAVRLLTYSPDGGMTSSYDWMRDFVTDLLLDGNALAVVNRSGGRPVSLTRVAPWESTTTRERRNMELVYELRVNDVVRTHSYRDVIHARFPIVAQRNGYTYAGGRDPMFFAPSPLIVIRAPYEIALSADKFIKGWFDAGGQSPAKQTIKTKNRLRDDELQQMAKRWKSAKDRGDPMILAGEADISRSEDNLQNVREARMYELQDIARVFGIPAPALGMNISQWGSGVSALRRMTWSFSGRQKMDAILSAMSLRLLPAGQRFTVSEAELLKSDPEALPGLINAVKRSAQADEILTVQETRRLLGFPGDPRRGEELRGPAAASGGAVPDGAAEEDQDAGEDAPEA